MGHHSLQTMKCKKITKDSTQKKFWYVILIPLQFVMSIRDFAPHSRHLGSIETSVGHWMSVCFLCTHSTMASFISCSLIAVLNSTKPLSRSKMSCEYFKLKVLNRLLGSLNIGKSPAFCSSLVVRGTPLKGDYNKMILRVFFFKIKNIISL